MGYKPPFIGALFAAFLVMVATSGVAENLYRYRADNGVLVVDFHVPVEYADNGYEVLDASGVGVSVVPRAMTPEERANVALSRELQEDAKSEQQRLQNWDESLLLRYSTIADIEDARDRSLSDLKIRVSILKSNRRSLRQQVENAQARVAATERAGVDPQPIDLESIKLLKREIESTDDKITTREAQITEMTALYQRDIDRFEQLQDVVRLRHQLETPTQ